jgi:UDP-2,4-diacetamido-2,4,6-trideoxy-beta-L-altropyranose hydrolase
MQIVFRTDASLAIGNGHVMRCLSLAQRLRTQGITCSFVCAQEAGHLNKLLKKHGFEIWPLELQEQDTRPHAETLLPHWQLDAQATQLAIGKRNVDWLVVDHYGLDQQWETMLSPEVARLMVIDDLANRPHQCDLLLDANPGRQASQYAPLIPTNCTMLAGPRYALIRDEIHQARLALPTTHDTRTALRILVMMGGVDKDNITGQVLSALDALDSKVMLEIQVVMGPFSPWINQLTEMSRQMHWPTRVVQNPDNFVELMCVSDIAIGAAGTSALERCCLGLPSVNFVLAPNQRLSALALKAAEASHLVELQAGWQATLHQCVRELQHHASRQTMRQACMQITDGSGTELVAQEMCHA